ncbi:tunicamycin resistance protein [Macrococcus brunensis]|uniref:Tunicamycin resistance protein n=1 Tax=Macrococcus brunensis TaxID=198483 RepID=A0A4R6BBE6_9STAP|nr:tunicamycin resistance protein [Macrococcus brunensis]TDL94300.1 tunicamycin resistance protein [Macrococcus brunensis]
MINKTRIIWLNGAFEVGKTTAAETLVKIIPHSFLFDPEVAEGYINHVIPDDIKYSDFQDHYEWRMINRMMINKLLQQYTGIIIIPMTITNEDYFYEITKDIDSAAIKNFLLAADRKTLESRLIKRGDNIDSWPHQQIERCLKAFNNTLIYQVIDTSNKEIDEIVSSILIEIN